jgi:anti-sigma-K factor RskA
MLNSFWKWGRTLLAAVTVLAIPVYAICALTTRAAPSANVALADSDDPIASGLRVMQRSDRTQFRVPAANDAAPQVVELTDWVFTSKGNPSPYK